MSLPRWGQVVVGPPGSGKTTYCKRMTKVLATAGRDPIVVNLDPANDGLPYACPIDVRELISLTDVMDTYGLGPNGGLVYCMEFLEKNMDWLIERLAAFPTHYFIFDCPGQAELYTHHATFASILSQLTKVGKLRLAAVHLVDAHHCSDGSKFIPAVLLSLSTMMRLELPHVNVLSKVDMIESDSVSTAFDIDFYTDLENLPSILSTLPGRSVEDFEYGDDGDGDGDGGSAVGSGVGGVSDSAVVAPEAFRVDGDGDGADEVGVGTRAGEAAKTATRTLSSLPPEERLSFIQRASKRRAAQFFAKFNSLNEALCGIIEDYSLVSFLPLNIEDKKTIQKVVAAVDRCNGFVRTHSGKSRRPKYPV